MGWESSWSSNDVLAKIFVSSRNCLMKAPCIVAWLPQMVSDSVEDNGMSVVCPDLAAVAPLLCAGITTYSPLVFAGVKKGMKVAVVGLGGLGHMGVKFAVSFGAEVTVISTSPSKEADAKKLGATHFLLSTISGAFYKYSIPMS